MDEVTREIEELFRADGPRMWRALLAYTGDPDVASDALAEAFAQALVRGSTLHSPAGWTWRTAFTIAGAEMKRGRQAGGRRMVEEIQEMQESVKDLVVAMQQLSPRQRAAVVLHDYVDRPTNEIASILNMNVATVRVHLSQGRRRLRKLLEDYR